MSNQTTINNLIRGVSQKDPQLYTALQQMMTDLYKVYGEVFPATSSALQAATLGITPDDVTGLTFLASPTNLRISWNDTINAEQYEIRKGSSWDTATYIVTTSQLVANIDPIINNLTVGDHTFLIKALSSTLTYSISAYSAVFTVPVISAPLLSGSAIQNSALLSWVDPITTWEISYYLIFRDSVEIGYTDGNFIVSSEIVAGTYEYTVKAVDIVGNESLESLTSILVLENPVDLVYVDSLNSLLNGTLTNTIVNGDGIIGAIISETYQEHFDDNFWSTPQDQIDAGYPEWLSPTGSTGSYRETFDFLTVYDNITINVIYSKINLFGSTAVLTDIEYSTDNATWSTPVTGQAVLATTFRYARITWNFTNSDDNSLAYIYNMSVTINTQQILDSGSGTANSADASGTSIDFNRTFKEVNSITLTSNSTTASILVYDEVGINDFKVYAFNTAGTRINADFSWKARGIV